MYHRNDTTISATRPDRHRGDRGFTLVEVLISVVLVGTVGVAGLGALRASVISSRLNRDHANAHAWLQTASDVLYGTPREDCGTPTASREAELRAIYLDVVRRTENPQGWPETNIEIVAPVQFWDGRAAYQNVCYDDEGINLQLIRLRVRNRDGEIVEEVEIVKG